MSVKEYLQAEIDAFDQLIKRAEKSSARPWMSYPDFGRQGIAHWRRMKDQRQRLLDRL